MTPSSFRPRAAIFDLDGTLVDSQLDLCHAVNHALRTVGLPERSLEEVTGFVGEGVARLVSRALGGRDDLMQPALAAWWSFYGDHLLDNTVLYPGVAELLASATIPLAVHTNKPGEPARRILEGLGVRERFVAVLGGDEAPRKPDPAGTRRLLEVLGVGASEALFVGDSLVDLEHARAVPMPMAAVSWGLVAPERLAAAHPEWLVAHPRELTAALSGR
jgi:phosphoglycolate phosphatase